MASQQERILRYLRRLLQGTSEGALAARLAERTNGEARHVPGGSRVTKVALKKRWQLLTVPNSTKAALLSSPVEDLERYHNNIENCIMPSIVVGTVGGGTALPTQRACLEKLGLAGPGNTQTLWGACARRRTLDHRSAFCRRLFASAPATGARTHEERCSGH